MGDFGSITVGEQLLFLFDVKDQIQGGLIALDDAAIRLLSLGFEEIDVRDMVEMWAPDCYRDPAYLAYLSALDART